MRSSESVLGRVINAQRLHGQFDIKIFTRAAGWRRNVSPPHIARPPLQTLRRARALSLPWQEIRKNNHHHRRNAVHELRLRPKYIRFVVQKKRQLIYTAMRFLERRKSRQRRVQQNRSCRIQTARISGSCTLLHTHTQLRIISHTPAEVSPVHTGERKQMKLVKLGVCYCSWRRGSAKQNRPLFLQVLQKRRKSVPLANQQHRRLAHRTHGHKMHAIKSQKQQKNTR